MGVDQYSENQRTMVTCSPFAEKSHVFSVFPQWSSRVFGPLDPAPHLGCGLGKSVHKLREFCERLAHAGPLPRLFQGISQIG